MLHTYLETFVIRQLFMFFSNLKFPTRTKYENKFWGYLYDDYLRLLTFHTREHCMINSLRFFYFEAPYKTIAYHWFSQIICNHRSRKETFQNRLLCEKTWILYAKPKKQDRHVTYCQTEDFHDTTVIRLYKIFTLTFSRVKELCNHE